jgi:hypothetical protein
MRSRKIKEVPMRRRSAWQLCVALAILLALVSPVFAGGWAVVTLDSQPSKIEAGQAIRLGFMVRQHGITPIDKNPWEHTPLAPVLSAKNQATGETIQTIARKDGPLGHFVVDVTFPSAGSWDMDITPAPFAGTRLGVFTVAAATTTSAGVGQAQPGLTDRLSLVGLSMALVLLVVCGLMTYMQRETLGQLLAARKGKPALSAEEHPTSSRLS